MAPSGPIVLTVAMEAPLLLARAASRYLDVLVRVMVAGLSSRLPADPVSPPLA